MSKVTDIKEGVTNLLRGAARADGWFSALGGYGVGGRDKRLAVTHYADLVTDQEAEDLWRGNDLAARVIETLPNEAFRQGFEVNAGDKEMSELVSARLEELDVLATFLFAKKIERAKGGSAIYPVINDSPDVTNGGLSLPLNLSRIPEISHLIVFEPRELQPYRFYESPSEKKFGQPMTYRVNPIVQGGRQVQQFEIHESRLIIFHGLRTSRSQLQAANNGWGDSVLARVKQVLSDYGIAWAATATLLHEFSQASFKIKGLAQLIATDRDDVIQTRIRAVELARSTINAVLMDADEQFERTQTPVSGLDTLLDRFATRVAAAADMPVTLLFGQSPSGLNATGESDIRFFYDRVAVEQRLRIVPQLERLVQLIFLSNDGPTKGKEPDTWYVRFNPLWQPSEQEIATTRQTVAQTDAIYIANQVFSPEECARMRFGGDTYSMETAIDFQERDELDAEETESAEGTTDVTSTPGAAGAAAENVAATAMNGAQVSSLMEVVGQVARKEISRESAIGILKIAFQLSPAQAAEVLGPEDFEPAKPEPKPSPFGGPKPPPPPRAGDEEEDPEDDPPEDDPPDPEERDDSRFDGGEGSGNPQGNPGPRKTLFLKPVVAGQKEAFRTRNLQKETGQTPAKIRELLAKAGIPGPPPGEKVWWFHKDDKDKIVAVIKNGGVLPEGYTDAKFGDAKTQAATVGSTPDKIAAKIDKISETKFTPEQKDELKAIVKGKASPVMSPVVGSIPPPPPAMSREALIKAAPKLPYEAQAAVTKYTGQHYTEINGYLRSGKTVHESYKGTIAHMDKAFDTVAASGGLPGGAVVYRGSHYEAMKNAGVKFEVGATISDKGFVSTSLNEHPPMGGSVLMEIRVPKGSKAMYVEKISHHKGEKELLIARGAKFKVTHMEVEQKAYGGKVTKIKVDLLPHD